MLDFCLILDLQKSHSEPDLSALSRLCPIAPEYVLDFALTNPHPLKIRAFWSAAHPHRAFHDRLRIDANGFQLLAGYPLTASGGMIRSLDAFDPDASSEYRADFFYLGVSPDGQITIRKSPICSYQLFHAQLEDRHILASRSGFAANLAGGNFDAEFARWACTNAIGGSRASIHERVDAVLMNEQISAGPEGISISPPEYSFLSDPTRAELYRSRPKQFWDETYDALQASSSVLNYSDRPIDVPLSGGKDSRLLLAMLLAGGHRDRLERIFTNGPAISPEVRSAALVCEALGLDHSHVDQSNTDQPRKIEIDRHLAMHAHITEGEMTPDDLTWGITRRDIIQLHGQEGGLRNVAAGRDVSDRNKLVRWFEIHLGEGDRCGMLYDHVAEQTRDDIRSYVDAALAAGIAPEDVPTLHRVTFRLGRWVARTWRNYNDRWFAPYLFVDTEIIRATFNSGAASRASEEFHFEMLRRVNPKLISIPFSGQTWDKRIVGDMALPDPLTWETPQQMRRAKPTHEAMIRSFDQVQAFFQTHEGQATGAILDRDKLAKLDITQMHPSMIHSLWQLIQIALFESAPDLQSLGAGLDPTSVGLPSFDY